MKYCHDMKAGDARNSPDERFITAESASRPTVPYELVILPAQVRLGISLIDPSVVAESVWP